MIRPPKWFADELRLFAPDIHAYFMEKYRKWFMVSFVDYRVLGITEYDPIYGKNFTVEQIVEDSDHNAVPLDRTALMAVKAAYVFGWRGKPFSYWLKQVKDMERKKRIPILKELIYRFRDFSKKAKKMTGKEMTWNLPGKEIPSQEKIQTQS